MQNRTRFHFTIAAFSQNTLFGNWTLAIYNSCTDCLCALSTPKGRNQAQLHWHGQWYRRRWTHILKKKIQFEYETWSYHMYSVYFKIEFIFAEPISEMHVDFENIHITIFWAWTWSLEKFQTLHVYSLLSHRLAIISTRRAKISQIEQFWAMSRVFN